jgi:tetratricopeptide (TPR) repeat protein
VSSPGVLVGKRDDNHLVSPERDSTNYPTRTLAKMNRLCLHAVTTGLVFSFFLFRRQPYSDQDGPSRNLPITLHGNANVLDQYSLCPCGSGKKFKWCCQPIHQEIAKAFQQDQVGQHEAALRIMDEVVAQHPENPEAWGKKALLLWQNEKPDDAEAALSKAFEVMPDYPFGHFLRGKFRLFEGEVPGALMLFRKAAEVYDPNAHQLLIEIFLNIFECEMKLNRPVAARAAAMLALKADPNNMQLRQGVDEVFSPKNPNLPLAATKAYGYHPTKKIGPAAWDKAMARINTSRLTDVLRAFGELAKADPQDPNVWYNLGLTQAWLGNNQAALEALDKYLEMEGDENLAVEAATLAEVLRVGQGMEDVADVVEHAATIPLRDPQAFVNSLVELEKERKVAGLRLDKEQGILAGFALGSGPPALITESAPQSQPVGAFFMLMGQILRIWSIEAEKVEAALAMFRVKSGAIMGEVFQTRGPAKFQDMLSGAVVVSVNPASQEEHDRIVREQFAKHFEETWIHQPRKSLGNVAPVDAAGSPLLRRKLLGALSLLEQIAGMGAKTPIYDFARLRRKLNLVGGEAPAATSATLDISAMNVEDLAKLPLDGLAPSQLELAFQTALGLDAKHVAGKYADALVKSPPRADRADRYPWHNHLINLALAEGDFQLGIDCLNEGEKDDCEHNEGRRRNDYELRRAQILVKKGDHQEAEEAFTRLIDRVPNEWKYRGSATESFLTARQGAKAVKFAETALAEAKKQNNRDQEGYFQELLEAARRQG